MKMMDVYRYPATVLLLQSLHHVGRAPRPLTKVTDDHGAQTLRRLEPCFAMFLLDWWYSALASLGE